MAHCEKFLTAQINSSAVRGLLDVSKSMNGALSVSGTISDTSIHYASTDEWNNKPDLIGKKGHIYVYNDYSTVKVNDIIVPVPNIKIGDGKAYLIDSPFITASVEDIVNLHITDATIHVSDEDRKSWNSKINCRINPDDPENVIFSNE